MGRYNKLTAAALWLLAAVAIAGEISSVEDIMNEWLASKGDDGGMPGNEVDSGDEVDSGNPPPANQRIKLCRGHPDIDATLKRGSPKYSYPANHPLVHPLLRPWVGGHPNMDNLLNNGKYYSGDHPKALPYVEYDGLSNNCYDYTNYVNATGCPVNVTVSHPNVDDAIRTGEPLPSNHPKVHDVLKPWMSPNHGNIDDMLAKGTELPFGHPRIDPYLCRNWADYRSADEGCATSVTGFHPSIDAAIARKEALPSDHPVVHHLFDGWLPVGHPNVDDLLASQDPLPLGHPYIDPYVCFGDGSTACVDVFAGHPEVDAKIRNGEGLPDDHPKVHELYGHILPEGHGNCDDYIRDKTPIPDWHPNLDDYICERSIISAGIVLAIAVSVIFCVMVLHRLIGTYCCGAGGAGKKKKYDKVDSPDKRDVIPMAGKYEKVSTGGHILGDESTEPQGHRAIAPSAAPAPGVEMTKLQQDLKMESVNSLEAADPSAPSPYMAAVVAEQEAAPQDASPLPRRNMQLHTMAELHAQHKNAELYDFADYKNMPLPAAGTVEVPGRPKVQMMDEKTHSCWSRAMVVIHHTRIPYFDWTLGNVILVLLYLGLNVVCLLLAPDHDIGRGSGSLAACNMMLLVIPACRNSIIALGLNVSFDRVVWLHRFVGRFAVGCVIVHGYYYLDSYKTQYGIFVTGVGALAIGVLIYITSLNYVRRNLFNLFFWTHYTFVGMLALVYIHVEQTHPFIIVAVVLYLADKLLRCLWMLWPRRTLLFTARSDVVAQVRFPKNPITKLIGFHEVGQYYFVNFPALSLTEWHPFSVSSGPREDSVELHIRDLGDHTKRIVELAKQKGKVNEHTWICIDGPYGQQNFNYRSYRVILLAAGGIGVTPAIGMLKDIYDVDVSPEYRKHAHPHAIETIFFLWAMPKIEDSELFWDEVQEFMVRAKNPDMPNLVPLFHITRSKEELQAPFKAGRPNIADIYRQMCHNRPIEQSGLVFACGPQPLVAELWDKSILQTVKGRQIDFHHEIFEF